MHENLKIVEANVERYRWLLQTNLTKARRKSVTQILGKHLQELKNHQGSHKRSWPRRDFWRGFPFG